MFVCAINCLHLGSIQSRPLTAISQDLPCSTIDCSGSKSAMRPGCFCLRPARDASHNAEVHREQTGLHATDSSKGATPGPQPVRAVSPADVRRTESGRVIKQKAEARLQAIREASTGLRVLGGQIVPCASLDRLESSSEVASFRFPAQVQQSSGRPQAKRILQPVANPLANCKQEKTLLQLLRPFKKCPNCKSDNPEPASVCKSILEASERRLQRYKQATTPQATAQMAIIQTFSDAYLLAISGGDQQWASATHIAASFSPDVVLKTQDKQTFYGKPAVLKRLNSGAAILWLRFMTVLKSCTNKNCWCHRCWYAIEACGQWQRRKRAKTNHIRSYKH